MDNEHLNVLPAKSNAALRREMDEAIGALSAGEALMLASAGVSRADLAIYGMVGAATVARVVDTELYEPDRAGVRRLLSPVRVQSTDAESSDSAIWARLGHVIDLVAWSP